LPKKVHYYGLDYWMTPDYPSEDPQPRTHPWMIPDVSLTETMNRQLPVLPKKTSFE